MKRLVALMGLLTILLCGCSAQAAPADIAATTLPVYEFTQRLCHGTGLTVTRLVTESVSCLHDYTLNVSQVKAAEQADHIVISGAGLEDFMADLLQDKSVIDASSGIALLESCHRHDHDHEHHHAESFDAHIWLSPDNALVMAQNIYGGLLKAYPEHQAAFEQNLSALTADIQALQAYGDAQLANIKSEEIITFHDGFSYFAAYYDLHIVRAIEEESGAEASAAELIDIISALREHSIRAIFTETNGSTSAAGIIAAETGAAVYTLDMAMAGESWFDAMYRNIDTIKEALE